MLRLFILDTIVIGALNEDLDEFFKSKRFFGMCSIRVFSQFFSSISIMDNQDSNTICRLFM